VQVKKMIIYAVDHAVKILKEHLPPTRLRADIVYKRRRKLVDDNGVLCNV
jgi:hypothetical protein